MKKHAIVFTPEAIEEVRQVTDWYDEQQKGLGKRFKSHLKKELSNLKKQPYSRTVRYDDVRFAILDIFPYAAHYTIDITAQTIIIQAVISYSQNPETSWKKRK